MRNAVGSQSAGECFHSFFEISHKRKYHYSKKEKQLVYLDHLNVNSLAHAIIMSTACAICVFLSSYRNTVLNQSVYVFALGYFLYYIISIVCTLMSWFFFVFQLWHNIVVQYDNVVVLTRAEMTSYWSA